MAIMEAIISTTIVNMEQEKGSSLERFLSDKKIRTQRKDINFGPVHIHLDGGHGHGHHGHGHHHHGQGAIHNISGQDIHGRFLLGLGNLSIKLVITQFKKRSLVFDIS